MGRTAGKKKAQEAKKAEQVEQPGPLKTFYGYYSQIAIAGIVIVGFLLRLFQLGEESLWLDEASSYYMTDQQSIVDVWNTAIADRHPPLHFLALYAVRLFGADEFWLRFPSAVAGALTVLAVYLLGKELMNEETGLIAAALLAVAPFHLLYSQEARMYAFAALFVTVAMYAFFRASRTGDFKDWALFGISCALAFGSHYYTSFAIIALFLGYFVLKWKEFVPGKESDARIRVPADFKYFLASYVIAFIIILPLAGPFLYQSGYWAERTFNWGLDAGSVIIQTFVSFSYMNEWAAVLVVLLMVGGFALLWTMHRERALTAGVLLLVPMAFSVYMSQVIPFSIRYHIYLISVVLVLAAIPLAYAGTRINKSYGVYGVVILVLVLSAGSLSWYYSSPLHEDWRGFAGNLGETAAPGDIVIPLPGYMIQPLGYYYDNTTAGTIIRMPPEYTETALRTIADADTGVYFVVTWDIQAADPSGEVVRYLNANTRETGGSTDGILLLKKVS